MSRSDRLIGVAIGFALGIVLVIVFVFGGGSEEIDAPSLDARPPAVERSTDPGAER